MGIRRAASIAVASLAALGLGVLGVTEVRLERRWPTAPVDVRVPTSAEAVARGRHLGEAIAQCVFCHGDDLAGKQIADDPWVGRLWAPNLTSGRGGLPADYRDADLVRAIRDGVGVDGRSLQLMPSEHLRAMSREDLGAVVAWVRSVRPVDAEHPATFAGPLTRLALASGLAPELLAAERIDHGVPPPPAPPAGETPGYGEYLVGVGVCRVCHHQNLEGGLHPLALEGEPPPSDLTGSGPLADWSREEFVRTLRSGTTPDGRTLDVAYMPWPRYAQMSDAELGAIWAYLETLP